MAKIAADSNSSFLLRQPGSVAPGKPAGRALAQGDGWTVDELVCVSGPCDRPFEERHSRFHIAIVVSGSFQYRSSAGRALMTPGSLLLGNAGQDFECGHEHGVGDRCISFGYDPEYFERITADMGAPGPRPGFQLLRLPPLRRLAPLVARVSASLARSDRQPIDVRWEELNIRLAARTIEIANGVSRSFVRFPAGAAGRVTRAMRVIERNPNARHDLGSLAREAGLSPYHFLRTFQRLTGVTPHQYLLRARLRRAAVCLQTERTGILDVAFDCGFGDVSNFNHAFRAEFGMSPRAYRFQKNGKP